MFVTDDNQRAIRELSDDNQSVIIGLSESCQFLNLLYIFAI